MPVYFMDKLNKDIKQACQAIKDADALFITAGAGMGVDSGLPDFRGNAGFWKAYPPIAKLGKSFSEMADPVWFNKQPEIAWAFYGHRLNLYRETIPHEGFSKLLDLGQSKPYGYFVFTSNVDGQFQKAGFDDALIEECHGSIHHLQCTGPCSNDIWEIGEEKINVDMETFRATGELPKCKNCGRLARPNILMFGDWNWISHRTGQQVARLQKWLEKLSSFNANLAIIEIGAGLAVPTVRYKSQRTGRNLNSTLIRINPRDYHVSQGAIGLPLGAREGINRILC
ncbi:SIR2 family NAD-dependent protein deacylase [Desulfobacter latus]|uniref:protein acetyllysine N-acetyltransferase n=1 Tax=Desulfobacter latus TaxID=2292 RepID=A0A850SXX8_9BACT|nr:Sir2 family NAD-dependent protein deacetylase [Desulfobacter latus]NWH06029.1 NAD-dependent deacetylase [Desulfobacter latus]